MTHHTFTINGTVFNVFDTQLGADHFKKKSEGDVAIVVRHKSVFMRRGEIEMTIRTEAGSGDDQRQKAAQAIIDEVEDLIGREMGQTDFPAVSFNNAALVDG